MYPQNGTAHWLLFPNLFIKHGGIPGPHFTGGRFLKAMATVPLRTAIAKPFSLSASQLSLPYRTLRSACSPHVVRTAAFPLQE